jgi:hypothetical protein
MRNQYKLLTEKYEQVLNEVARALTPEDEQAIVDMFKQGIEQNIPDYTNVTKLADMMGVTTKPILNILKRNGLDGLLKKGEKMLPGGEVGYASQKHPPSQFKKVEELLSKQQYDNASGPYLYSQVAAALEINKMIDGPHGEEYRRKGWVPFLIDDGRTNKHTHGKISGPFAPAVKDYYRHHMSPELRQRRKEYGFYSTDGRIYGGTFKDKTGTRQQATGELGISDPSYSTAMGRAQPIDDQEGKVADVNTRDYWDKLKE